MNNVALVGHSHPSVTAAATEQLKLLNTNSRFIYPSLGKFTAKLTELISLSAALDTPYPNPIPADVEKRRWVVFLVNSGSEATDLALRIARTVANYRRNGTPVHLSIG